MTSRDASFSVSQASFAVRVLAGAVGAVSAMSYSGGLKGIARTSWFCLFLFGAFCGQTHSFHLIHLIVAHLHLLHPPQLPYYPTARLPGGPTHLPSLMGSPHHRFVPWLTFPAEINLCTDTLDWERLQEIRESIVTRAPIFIPPALVTQAPSPSPRQSLPASQPRSQALPQSSYYQPAARPQTPPNYAMAQFGQSGYGALNGLRSQNPPAHPFPAPQGGPSGRLRPNGLVPPTIAYKSSPFYELKYQIGDVKTLEGASAVIPPPPLR